MVWPRARLLALFLVTGGIALGKSVTLVDDPALVDSFRKSSGFCELEAAVTPFPSGPLREELHVPAPAYDASAAWVETTYMDFADGTLDDGGAQTYVSAKGNVQPIDRRDFNQDGYIDLVFVNTDWGGQVPPSFIFWGGADGINPTRKSNVASRWGIDSVSADFNDDGRADLFITHWLETYPNHVTASRLWWGGTGGIGQSGSVGLTNNGATGCAVADLNRDGYLDLLVSTFPKYNYLPQETFLNIYWGGADYTFSTTRRTQINTVGAVCIAVADLNKDGDLDIVLAVEEETRDRNGNSSGARKRNVPSMILWGKTGTYSADRVTWLPTYAAVGATVADLDTDGWLDVIVANHKYEGDASDFLSQVFWGGPDGYYGANRRTDVLAKGAVEISVADLDNDTRLDMVFALFFYTPQRIYWGSGGRSYPDWTGLTPVEGYGGFGTTLADFNRDGRIDIAMVGYDDIGPLYWNDNQRFASYNSGASPLILPALGGHFTTSTDVGHPYHRRLEYLYLSSPHHVQGSPIYRSLSWAATTPVRTSVSLQVRAATTRSALASASWSTWYLTSPASLTGAGLDGLPWVQYQARLTSEDGANYPVLDEVVLSYDLEVEPTPTPLPPDADGDLLPDELEGWPPASCQGNRWLPDSDGDGLLDGEEDNNQNGRRDAGETCPRAFDSDGDGVWDGIEVLITRSDPLNPALPLVRTDADRDGLPQSHDLDETRPDFDGDRYGDGYESVTVGGEGMIAPQIRPALGDVNLDHYVTNVDALASQSIFLDLVGPQVLGTRNADPNRDGLVSNVDALMLQAYFLELVAVFP